MHESITYNIMYNNIIGRLWFVYKGKSYVI